MTYDSEQKIYRMWSFLSNCSTSEASGKQDETIRTMTSTSRQAGTTTTTTAKFSDNGIEEWLLITTNQNNEVVGRFGGANTLRFRHKTLLDKPAVAHALETIAPQKAQQGG